MPAAQLALEDVNRDENLLPGFELKMYSNDSEVSLVENLIKSCRISKANKFAATNNFVRPNRASNVINYLIWKKR